MRLPTQYLAEQTTRMVVGGRGGVELGQVKLEVADDISDLIT